MTRRIVSLFSGYGGLELGVQSVLGGEVIAHVEFDAAPSAILAHHWPDVPNLGDVTTADWDDFLNAHPELGDLTGTYRPSLIIVGGFPCQDVSLAGARRGLQAGTRSGLWTHFARAISTLRPELVVIENVRGLLSADGEPWHDELTEAQTAVQRATTALAVAADFTERKTTHVARWRRARVRATRHLKRAMARLQRERRLVRRAIDTVLRDLADLGYDASWGGLRAADAGAPHGRFRVFIVARPADADDLGGSRDRCARSGGAGSPDDDRAAKDASVEPRGERRLSAPGQAPSGRPRTDAGGRGGASAADASGRDERRRAARDVARSTRARQGEGDQRERDGDAPTDRAPAAREWGPFAAAVLRWERITGRVAPAPTNPDGRDDAHRLAPEFVEWMMGLPAGHVTGAPITRAQMLKALGNGVVPQQAALALATILSRAEWALAA